MVIRKRNAILAFLVAALCAACARGERATTTAGPFKVVRTQHAYTNWSTGSRTTYYRYDVRYRHRDFQFAGFTYYGGEQHTQRTFKSTEIARAYLVSREPAALLVLAGDPNNEASWSLLIDTPSGLRAEHVAFHAMASELVWLDDTAPAQIERWRDQLVLEGGRWLWVDDQALIDVQSVRVYRLPWPRGSRDGAQFVAYSPDRQRLARFGFYTDPQDFRVSHPVIIENTIATGEYREFDIDVATMWFDDNRDVDQAWLGAYFEWHERDGEHFLQRRAQPAERPYHGRLEVESYSKALQYRIPRIRFEHRKAVMEFVTAAVGGTYVFDEPVRELPAPPPAATATPTAADAVAAPPVGGALVRADLTMQNHVLAVYFSDGGLSIENREPTLNDWVRKIATALDAALATAEGRVWIAEHAAPQ
jgi:hypothetical protein